MNIKVALCANEKYALACMVTIASLFKHNQHNSCAVYVLTDGFSQSTLIKFKRLEEKYGQTIVVKTVDANSLKGVKVSPYYSIMTYYRFFLPHILEESDKVLYMDCDMLVRKPLDDLWSTDITEYACAAVEDQNGDDISFHNRLNISGSYYNAGLLLMNLSYWRNNKTADKMIDFLQTHRDICLYYDQDALNVLLEGKIKPLPYKYNMQEDWLININSCKTALRKHDTILSDAKDPTIVHFCYKYKPWHVVCRNPYQHEFLSCLNENSFVGNAMKYANLRLLFFRMLNKFGDKFHKYAEKFR